MEKGRYIVVSVNIRGIGRKTCIVRMAEGGKVFISEKETLNNFTPLQDETTYLQTYGWEPLVEKMTMDGRDVYSGFNGRGGSGKITRVEPCKNIN